jgi:TRAP-type uncharacterized transport system fused permease subunit
MYLNTVIWRGIYAVEFRYLIWKQGSTIVLFLKGNIHQNAIFEHENTPRLAVTVTGLCAFTYTWQASLAWVWRESAALTVIQRFYFHESKTERKSMNSIAQRMSVRGSISLLFCLHKGRRKTGTCTMAVLVSFMLIGSVNARASHRRKYSRDKGIFLRECLLSFSAESFVF